VRALCVVAAVGAAVLAFNCGSTRGDPCAGFHAPRALPQSQPEGGLCNSASQCSSGFCSYVMTATASSTRQLCGDACNDNLPCAAGRVCMRSSRPDAGICARTCANAGECSSVNAEEFCELSGDDAGTRVCMPHYCDGDSQCGTGFECQNTGCNCPQGAQCIAAFPNGFCGRK
jgi:hypothetical protein